MLRAALSYPTRKPDGPRSVLVGGGVVFLTTLFGVTSVLGGVVGVVSVLGLLPWLALRGYYVRVLRTSVGRDRPTPPALADAERLVRDGAIALGVSAAYLLPGVVVLAPLVYARAVGTDLAPLFGEVGLSPGPASVAVSATGFLAIVAAMYLIGALYATPVAVTRFAYEDRVGAAFEVRRVVDGALTEDYAVAWAVAVVLQVVLFPVAYVLRAALVGFFLHFVVAVAMRYCYARGVGEGLDLAPVVRDPDRPDRDAGSAGDGHPTNATPPDEGPTDEATPSAHTAASDSGAAATPDTGSERGAGPDENEPAGPGGDEAARPEDESAVEDEGERT
jgi:hypothetical protein